ncbi:MAG: hypothetical protein JOY56_02760 [Solirubrobacterales bacterium]|nr:hypothetical protein [Solirubrobacterales bacterium]
MIEYLRLIAKQPVNPETVEDAWAMLGDSHVVREALEKATTEIEAAISALEARVREDPRPRGEVLPLSVALVNAQPGTGAPANTDGLVRTA